MNVTVPRWWMTTAFLLLASGCSTLGPVPVVSGQSMAVDDRTNVEAQVAAVPGYYLSATTGDDRGTPQRQVAAMLEPSDLIPVRGLSAGGRWVAGGDEGGHIEPMLRYRAAVDDEQRFGLGAVVWGASHEGSTRGASYDAMRVGAEVGTDLRVSPVSHWVEAHVMAALALTLMSASGSYCADDQGRGRDCDTSAPDPERPNATADVGSVYPAGTLGLGLDVARGFDGIFHGVRVFGLSGAGWMPRVRSGVSPDRMLFHTLGLGVQATVGASK